MKDVGLEAGTSHHKNCDALQGSSKSAKKKASKKKSVNIPRSSQSYGLALDFCVSKKKFKVSSKQVEKKKIGRS